MNLVAVLGLIVAFETGAAAPSSVIASGATAPHRGVYEVTLKSDAVVAPPYEDAPTVTFTRPNGSTVRVDAFFDGTADGRQVFKARAYCDRKGKWSWVSGSQHGAFKVRSSRLPGKLRIHPKDPYQFAYDNGQWYLHLGDTGYRYVVATEPEWRNYIDQAVAMGATKIRTWFCQSRSGVEALFNADRTDLNLPYWQEIDRRLQYALERYPSVIFQLIPYGEDAQELLRYAKGDAMSRLVARYAQARLDALPNVCWCISNDQTLQSETKPRKHADLSASVIDAIAQDMAARDPWDTLLTNHQARYTGYAFTEARWSDITTFEDLDQVAGALVLEYREKAKKPVVNEEDRYEIHERPENPLYYFRRLMWASLLSGGHPTFGGARTYEPYDAETRGVRGYYDLKKEGVLVGGADCFKQIHSFFDAASVTLVGMQPSDAMAGADPAAVKVAANDRAVIVYLANPDKDKPKEASAANVKATCSLALPAGSWRLRWFNPRTGVWTDAGKLRTPGDTPQTCSSPFEQDAVLLATRTR